MPKKLPRKRFKRTFTIDRAHWRCGRNGPHSHGKLCTQLLDADGMMCCLGHVCLQCGIPRRAICNMGAPADISERARNFRKLDGVLVSVGVIHDSKLLTNEAIEINDRYGITEAQREQLLTFLFNRHGFGLKFKGKFPREVTYG